MDIELELKAVREIEEKLRCPRDNGIQVEEKNCFGGNYTQWKCTRCGFAENDATRHWRAIAKRQLEGV